MFSGSWTSRQLEIAENRIEACRLDLARGKGRGWGRGALAGRVLGLIAAGLSLLVSVAGSTEKPSTGN